MTTTTNMLCGWTYTGPEYLDLEADPVATPIIVKQEPKATSCPGAPFRKRHRKCSEVLSLLERWDLQSRRWQIDEQGPHLRIMRRARMAAAQTLLRFANEAALIENAFEWC